MPSFLRKLIYVWRLTHLYPTPSRPNYKATSSSSRVLNHEKITYFKNLKSHSWNVSLTSNKIQFSTYRCYLNILSEIIRAKYNLLIAKNVVPTYIRVKNKWNAFSFPIRILNSWMVSIRTLWYWQRCHIICEIGVMIDKYFQWLEMYFNEEATKILVA